MLKAEGKINDGFIEKLMAWHHSGFSIHAGNQIARDDREGQKALAEYILKIRLLREEDHLPRGHRQSPLPVGHDSWKQQKELRGLRDIAFTNIPF